MSLRINLGSGQRKFAGWTNVDCCSREGQVPDVVADARSLPFPDGSAEMVALHHVIEHFGCGEADGVLRECFRVLAPGGSLFVFVPDMRKIAQRWLMGGIDDFIFLVNTYGAYQGEEGDRHKWGYHEKSLMEYLCKNPWKCVKPFDWRKVDGAEFACDWWVAAVECVR